MIEWFRRLAPREQLVLAVGTMLAIVIVAWTFVWSPLRTGAGELDATVAERSRQVVDLRRAAGLASESPGVVVRSGSSPTVLVEETARPFELSSTIYRSQPDGSDAINVSFRDARFDRLVDWLVELERTHGFAVVSASFTAAGGAGLVSGQVRLDRS